MTFRYLHFAFVATKDADIQPHHRSLKILQISENTVIKFGLHCKTVSDCHLPSKIVGVNPYKLCQADSKNLQQKYTSLINRRDPTTHTPSSNQRCQQLRPRILPEKCIRMNPCIGLSSLRNTNLDQRIKRLGRRERRDGQL